MSKISVGREVRFVPSSFAEEKECKLGGKLLPHELTGTITYVNPAHRMYLVEATVHGKYTIRESFKY